MNDCSIYWQIILFIGQCYEFSLSYPRKSDYVPGETFSFGCSGTLQQGDIVQFLKVNRQWRIHNLSDGVGDAIRKGERHKPIIASFFP